MVKRATQHGLKQLVSALLAIMIMAIGVKLPSLPIQASAAVHRKIINVVFVLDSTGSMTEEISNVRSNLSTFVNYLKNKSGIDELRMAIVDYKDTTDDGLNSTVIHKNSAGSPWFTDTSEMVTTINGIRITGGGDNPETVIDALGYLTCSADEYSDAVTFNSDAYKFAFVLTDADYKTNNRFGITGMSDMISRLNEKGIYTSVVCPTSYQSDYQSLYEQTNGIWMNINGNFATNMQTYAESIIETVRPDELDMSLTKGVSYNFYKLAEAYMTDLASVEYSSSNTSVISFSAVSPNVGTAVNIGTCKVTISDGTYVLICNVTVEEEPEIPVRELAISTEVIVGVDQSVYVKAVALPEEASEKGLIWSVKDTSIAQIVETDSNLCLLKGLKSGTTVLTAVTKDGGYAGSASITVSIAQIVPVTGVSVSITECTMKAGESASVTGSVLPANSTNKGGYWYSTDSDIVAITSSSETACTFKAITCGTAKIYFVSNEGGFSKAITVTIAHEKDSTPIIIENATCTEDGISAYICKNCHEIIETFYTEVIPHDWGDWVIDCDATCEEDGLKHHACSVCGEKEYETVYASAHFYTNEVSGFYGDVVEMQIYVEENSYLNDVQFVFNFDATTFEINSVTFNIPSLFKRAIIDNENGILRIMYSGDTSLTEETLFATIELKTKKCHNKIINAIEIDKDAYNVAHTLIDGNTVSISFDFNEDFGKIELKGADLNGDYVLDIRDLYCVLDTITSMTYDPFDPALIEIMDVNGDGVVDIADLTYLQYLITLLD